MGSTLDDSQVSALAEHTDRVTKANEQIAQAGAALREIKETGLYRDQYPSFEAYCQARWGFSAAYAYRLMLVAGPAVMPA